MGEYYINYKSPSLEDVKQTLSAFVEQRNARLNLVPPEIHDNPKIEHRMGAVKKQSWLIFTKVCGKLSTTTDDNVPLLNSIAAYKSIYTAPQTTARNPIVDRDIVDTEYSLISTLSTLHNNPDVPYADLMELANNIVNLLALVHMRYKISLDSRNDYIIYMIRSTEGNDKMQYAKIINQYMEEIVHGCIRQAIAKSTTVADYAAITKIIDNLQEYVYQPATAIDDRANKKIAPEAILDHLRQLCVPPLDADASHDLRKRRYT